jgi:DNA primase
VNIPDTYILNKFYTHAYEPSYRKGDGIYNAGCPVCKEGKSLGKKKRLFFYPQTKSFYCFNCGKSWSAFNWLLDVTRMSKEELRAEIITNGSAREINFEDLMPKSKTKNEFPLPKDSINLKDKIQLSYHQNNKIIQKALDYITHRNLENAINAPDTFFISLKDPVHKNRLGIPFYDRNNKIVFYQTRCLDESYPKYLSKINADKSLFNIHKINTSIDSIFLLEGPVDAMFIKNGVAVAGLNLTTNQQKQLTEFPLHQKIWILDNPKIDNTSREKIKDLLLQREKVFKWPEDKPYKDLNEWAIKENLLEIDFNYILKNLYF